MDRISLHQSCERGSLGAAHRRESARSRGDGWPCGSRCRRFRANPGCLLAVLQDVRSAAAPGVGPGQPIAAIRNAPGPAVRSVMAPGTEDSEKVSIQMFTRAIRVTASLGL